MGRVYTASFGGIAVSAIQDLLEVNAPSDAIVSVLSIVVGQSSDFGDAAAEMLRIQVSRAATSGSGGASVTPRPHQVGAPAYGGTVERNNSTQAGTPTVLLEDTWNIQAGWQWRATPKEEIIISPSGILVVELPVAPSDAITMSASITFEEIGG